MTGDKMMEYIFTFIEGFASFISPCVLPLLPLYVSYFAGKDGKKYKALINSIAFVLGFSIVFITLAIIANKVGATLVKFTNYAKNIFGIAIIVLGLNYIGFLNLKIFEKFKKFDYNVTNLNFISSILFGVMFSISMTPCVGTFLASALLLIARKEDLIKGIVLMLMYCIGLGIPFILSAILIDKLKKLYSLIKKNYKVVKFISGIILIIMGIYLIYF